MAALIVLLLAAHAIDPAAVVRDQRSAYNAAIARHDLAPIERLLTPDYVVLPGLIGTPRSKAQLLDLFATAFRDPTFITYDRIAERILPSGSGKRIAETGRWIGSWQKADGRMTETGVYLAMWVKRDDGWKLINESFVTLRCTGSSACASEEQKTGSAK
jgi:ketosteroid isomerase-like protein